MCYFENSSWSFLSSSVSIRCIIKIHKMSRMSSHCGQSKGTFLGEGFKGDKTFFLIILLARCFGCYANHTNNIQVMTNFTLEEFDELTLQVVPIIQVHAKSIPKMFHVANEKSQHAPTRRINSIWMNRVKCKDLFILKFRCMRPLKDHKRLYGWGENTPFAWKFSWNNGGRHLHPKMSCFCFMVCPSIFSTPT